MLWYASWSSSACNLRANSSSLTASASRPSSSDWPSPDGPSLSSLAGPAPWTACEGPGAAARANPCHSALAFSPSCLPPHASWSAYPTLIQPLSHTSCHGQDAPVSFAQPTASISHSPGPPSHSIARSCSCSSLASAKSSSTCGEYAQGNSGLTKTVKTALSA